MKSNDDYNSVFITLKLSARSNKRLTESALRSSRKKVQEATLRLEDHLGKFRSISELNHTTPQEEMDVSNDSNSNS